MKARTSTRLAWSLALISTLLAAFASVLLVVNGVTLRDILFEGAAVGPQLALTFPIVGAIIASRHPVTRWGGSSAPSASLRERCS